MSKLLHTASAACLVAIALIAPGCGRRLSQTLGLPNQPPTVRLSGTASPSGDALQVSHRLAWIGADPDGRVDHYLVATHPRSVDRVDDSWQAVRETERTITLRRAPPGAQRMGDEEAREPEIFAVRAVDDRGAVSDPAYRAMFAENVAPSVQIIAPKPSHLGIAYVPSRFRVLWQGNDPDGPDPTKLAKYKFKLLTNDEPGLPLSLLILDPDSLRRLYAPAFATWDSVPGDSLGHDFTGLEINRDCLFAIVGFDVAGDYSPVFSLDANLLLFRVGFSSALLPRITMYNDYFNYASRGGSGIDRPIEVAVEAPAGQRFTVNWSAEVAYGSRLAGYRWALDIADVNDEAPRRGVNDLAHWSAWSPTTTTATMGPFHGPAAERPHRFYIEAQDSWGGISLGIVRFTLIRSSFEGELLIVDDTRLTPDVLVSGQPDSLAAPSGLWPTAAELDTFLFARGGVRWRMYPGGTISRPGLFAGYHYDTLGTRTGKLDLTVPLAVLGRYRHVIWILDARSALMDRGGDHPIKPISALRYMGSKNRENTLAAYAKAGGQVWMLGGGAGTGVMGDRDNLNNGIGVFSPGSFELVPGVMMYDLSHWRSEFRTVYLRSRPILTRIAPMPAMSRNQHDDDEEDDGAASRTLNYSMLPASLQVRDLTSDVLPPLRYASTFVDPVATIEYLSAPNVITESRDPPGQRRDAEEDHGRSHRKVHTNSVLDSLYRADASDLPPAPAINACMTLYHGRESGQVIFSGLDLWTWRRTQCVQLVDGVLQGLWGLTRDPVARAAAAPQPVATDRTGDR